MAIALITHELLSHYIARSLISNFDSSYEMIRTILYEINRFVSDIGINHICETLTLVQCLVDASTQ